MTDDESKRWWRFWGGVVHRDYNPGFAIILQTVNGRPEPGMQPLRTVLPGEPFSVNFHHVPNELLEQCPTFAVIATARLAGEGLVLTYKALSGQPGWCISSLNPVQTNGEIPENGRVFDAKQLRNCLKPVWEKLDRADEAVPFRVPVDPDLLNIPDYFDIIKRPMDLMTIHQKLDRGECKNPWEFCDDMWLMFDNAWLYNRKNSKVYKSCTKLSEIFIEEINPVMEKMGYCCGQKRAFTPLTLFCYGRSTCVIARDELYYLYEAGSMQNRVTVTYRYVYCVKCFETLPPDAAQKSKFQLEKNDRTELVPYQASKVCKRQWHTICANYRIEVSPEDFICKGCRTEKDRPKAENKPTAK
ncbi:CBP-B protein, partial [Aphelenchoides avenae]